MESEHLLRIASDQRCFLFSQIAYCGLVMLVVFIFKIMNTTYFLDRDPPRRIFHPRKLFETCISTQICQQRLAEIKINYISYSYPMEASATF